MQAYVLFVCPGRLKLFLALDIFDIAAYHQGDLEGQGVIETADVQAGLLFQFFNPVEQGVSVDEEFAGCLGYIELFSKKVLTVVVTSGSKAADSSSPKISRMKILQRFRGS